MSWAELKEKKNFCVLPFIHTATLTDGEVPLCCVSESQTKINLNSNVIDDYWSSNYLKDVRKKMINNMPVKDCSRCQEEESSGYRSHRRVENKAWEEKLGVSKLDHILSQAGEDGFSVQGVMSIDLRLGNTCNLQCVMCQPRESSKWKAAGKSFISELSENKLSSEWREKSNIKIGSFEWYQNERFWENLKSCLPTLRELIIGGGEPMLIKEHLEFIKYCAESGEACHIHLRYHTNLTVFPEEMIPYWEKFEKVEFFASIDGIDEIANYVRYPSRWNEISDNLQKVDNLGDNVWLRILFSVHALNAHHLPDFINWVENQKFKKAKMFPTLQGFVHPGLVHWPEYLNIKVLPKEYKGIINQRWRAVMDKYADQPMDKYAGVLEFMNSQDWAEKLNLMTDYMNALDKYRKTDSYALFPQLREHILSHL